MQFSLTTAQEQIQHEWFKGLTPQEILCVVGYYLLGLSSRDMAEAMGFGNYPVKVWRIARRGAAKAPMYIRTDKRRAKHEEICTGDNCVFGQKR